MNRSVMAARAASNPAIGLTRPVGASPSTDLRAREITRVLPTGAGVRKGKRPGRDKGQGEWRTVSANNRLGRSAGSAAWDRTVSWG
jgi:hypothetical protein